MTSDGSTAILSEHHAEGEVPTAVMGLHQATYLFLTGLTIGGEQALM